MQGLETFIDAFAGIGGFRIAGEQNKLRCVGAIENDKWARQTYAKNFRHEPEFGDIRQVDPKAVPDHDLFCAGFPCQSFSWAGKKRGMSDARGTLFFEICRVLDAKRPSYVLLENVKALLQAPFVGEGGKPVPETAGWVFYRILESLGDLGYAVQWQVLDGRHWVAQHRERTYIIGSARGVPFPEVFPLFDDTRKVAGNQGKKSKTGRIIRENLYETPGQAGVIFGAEGLAPTLDTCANNAQVEDSRGWRSDSLGNIFDYRDKRPPKPWHPGQTGRVYGPGSTCPTLSTCPEPLLEGGGGLLRVLTPTERERLMGFPDGWTEGVSDVQRIRQTGNAVVTRVAAAILEQLAACHANGGERPTDNRK